jgi:hypothetical protein
MAEEQESSLRQAMNAIMGWPAGGGATTPTGGGTTQGAVNLPAATPFSTTNLGTTAAISNVVPAAAPDPFAAELAAIQAQNAVLASQLGLGGSTGAAISPAAAAPTRRDTREASRDARLAAAAPATTAADSEAALRASMAASGVSQQAIDQHIAAMNSVSGGTAFNAPVTTKIY